DCFFEIMFGAAKSNNATVAVNWRLSQNEIAYIVNDAQVEILFVGPEYFSTVEAIRPNIRTVRKIIAIGGSHPEWASLESWLDGKPDSVPEVKISGSDVVLQMYTSGTTGHPKGAQLTNANLLTMMPALVHHCGNWND